jgi:hypothetical protein
MDDEFSTWMKIFEFFLKKRVGLDSTLWNSYIEPMFWKMWTC